MEEATKIELADERISRESPEYEKVIGAMRETLRIAERAMTHTAPCLLNERYFTTRDILYHLRISRRALQNYRDSGIIPYLSIGRVILYPESELRKVLEKNYYKAF